jgi:hypothetical protein
MLKGDVMLMLAYFVSLIGVMWKTVGLALEWALRNFRKNLNRISRGLSCRDIECMHFR